MLGVIGEKDDTIEKDSSQSCICAFKLAFDETYIGDSFSVSTFVWAVAKIIAEKNLRTDFNTVEIDKLNSQINDILASMGNKVEYKDLEKVYAIVDDRVNVLILDDTMYERNSSKKVELLSKMYDHAKKSYKLGFRLLTLGWSDGNTFLPVNSCLLSSENMKNRIVDAKPLDKRTATYYD